MSIKSSVYPSKPAQVDQGRIMMPVTAKAGGIVPPFNRIMDETMFIDRNPLTRPMEQSVWVMRAIKRIAEPICAVPLEFHLTAKDGAMKPYADPVVKMFWKKPAQNLSYEEFILALIGWNKLKGEFFILLDDTWLKRGMAKSKPIVARPDAMREIINHGELVGWEWNDPTGSRHYLIPDQVIHHKEWNPYNPWRGLSEMVAAKNAAETDFLQGKFAGNLARNNGNQGDYVIANGNPPTDEQQRQIVAQLRMKRQAALRGELREVFLSGDLKVQPPTIQTPDADFVAQRLENRHEIFIAFGVPPSLCDVVASYSIGQASDRYLLIEDTCIPMSKKIVAAVETITRRLLDQDELYPLTALFNFDQHSVMLQVRTERLNATDKLWTKGVPMKTVNDYLKLNLPEYEGWEKGYLPFNVAPVDDQTDPTTDPSFSEAPLPSPELEEETDPLKTIARAFAARGATSKREAMWKQHMAHQQGSVKNYRTKFNRALMTARGEVLAKLAAHHQTGKSIEVKAGAASNFMFDLHKFTGEFKGGMDSAGRSAFDEAGQQVYDELGKDDPWISPPAKVKAFLATRENRLKNVPQEVFDTIKNQLTEGIDKGESIKDLAARVRSTFNEIGTGRGKTIAMTETTAAYGTARQESMTSAGVQYKEWLTSHNANVRPAHAEAEGQVRQIGDPFDVDGEELDYPGDPEGSPENVINCHCVSIPVASDDEKALRCVREKRKSI